jgi:hypothetical protein
MGGESTIMRNKFAAPLSAHLRRRGFDVREKVIVHCFDVGDTLHRLATKLDYATAVAFLGLDFISNLDANLMLLLDAPNSPATFECVKALLIRTLPIVPKRGVAPPTHALTFARANLRSFASY